MKEQNKTTNELIRALGLSAKDAQSIKLSKASKARILREIIPEKKRAFYFTWQFAVPAMSLALVLFMAMTYASKPGSTLYSVRQKVDDVQSSVKDSAGGLFGVKKSDPSVSEDKKSSSSSSSSSTSPSSSSSTTKEDAKHSSGDDSNSATSTTTTTDDTTHSTSDDDSTSSGGGTTDAQKSGGSNSTPGGNGNPLSPKDQCKADLDAAKKAGDPSVTSDSYKACDNLI